MTRMRTFKKQAVVGNLRKCLGWDELLSTKYHKTLMEAQEHEVCDSPIHKNTASLRDIVCYFPSTALVKNACESLVSICVVVDQIV